MPRVTTITSQEVWENTAARFAQAKELAIDTESNSLYVYRERTCLIQLATAEEAAVLDPLAVDNLDSLGKLLEDQGIGKALHGSDYDLRSLDRDYGFRIGPLFDTQIGARFLGHQRPNLAAVLETYLGVGIPKSRRLQRCDWGRRPLSDEAVEYASNDVEYLVALAEEIRRRLADMGRLEWVEEECRRLEQVRYSPPEPPDTAFLNMKGNRGLDGRELVVLKELYLWRETQAQREDVPSFRVASNDDLAAVCRAAASEGTEGLEEAAPGLARRLRGRGGAELRASVARGLAGEPVARPERPGRFNPWTADSRKRLTALKQARSKIGAGLGLDPALVWPMGSLERMALAPEDWRREVDGGGEAREWQRRQFGDGWGVVLG